VVLLAAALHAVWNAIVKTGSDKLLTTLLVASAGAVIAACALPFVATPAQASWPFMVASPVLEIIYFWLIARTYEIADMSEAYPLMRGLAPLWVTLISHGATNDQLSTPSSVGIALICAGVLSVAAHNLRGGSNQHAPAGKSLRRRGIAFALLNSVVIAGYTVIDGIGVRKSGAPVAYTLWLFVITGAPLAMGALLVKRKAFVRYFAQNWHLATIGGIGTLGSYGLALWAMTLAPVAMIAALRETSIIFGLVIAIVVLKEPVLPVRIVAACIIATGAAVLRLS
jgi:drug/metabolite transporter (DMT)-like permease